MYLSQTKPVRIALVGCGAVSEVLHAATLRTLSAEGLVETAALVDPNSERAAKLGRVFPRAQRFRDVDTMSAKMTPDLVIIATPHRLHAELSIQCLERGFHVLCEKPMATDTAACDRMIKSAEKAGRVLAVGHFKRGFPSCKIMKHVLDSQVLGPVRSFRFLEGETFSWPAQSASFFKRGDSGGGVLIDAGAHTLDFLLWWLGDVAEVRYQDDAMGGVEANCLMRVKMASGATGTVQLSQDWPLPNRYVVECDKGWIAYTYDVVNRVEWGLHNSDYGLNAEIRSTAPASRNGMRELGSAMPGFTDCFATQLRNVVAAIHGTEPLEVSPRDARKVIALIEECYRSRGQLEMPWLDELEMQRAKELAHG